MDTKDLIKAAEQMRDSQIDAVWAKFKETKETIQSLERQLRGVAETVNPPEATIPHRRSVATFHPNVNVAAAVREWLKTAPETFTSLDVRNGVGIQHAASVNSFIHQSTRDGKLIIVKRREGIGGKHIYAVAKGNGAKAAELPPITNPCIFANPNPIGVQSASRQTSFSGGM